MKLSLSAKSKTVLIHGAKALGAIVVGFVASWVVSPDVLAIVPNPYDVLVTAVVAPGLLALDKALRS
jgi:hypothetical protein